MEKKESKNSNHKMIVKKPKKKQQNRNILDFITRKIKQTESVGIDTKKNEKILKVELSKNLSVDY